MREFLSAPCLSGKKNLMTARVSMFLKSRASLTRLRTCFLPGRAKDLSAPRYLKPWIVWWMEYDQRLQTLKKLVLQNILASIHLSSWWVRDKQMEYTLNCTQAVQIQHGLVLRRFVLRRFTFTTPVQSDRALPTCGPSLSQLKCPFCTQCASNPFPLYMCFCFLYFSAVLLS